jgi:hypothetical protein
MVEDEPICGAQNGAAACPQGGASRPICCHSFRATGITNYLLNGGTLENAQMMS